MLTNNLLRVTPLLTNLFFILGVFIFYEIVYEWVRLLVNFKRVHVPNNVLKPWLGVLYVFILLFAFQTTIANQPTNWLFINFQIIGLIFCSVLLNVPMKYHIFIPIILIFMICNNAIFYWESWCFGVTLILFYESLNFIKQKRAGSFPFIYYILDSICFGAILWTLVRIKFSLDTVIVLKQLTYLSLFIVFAVAYIGLILRNSKVKKSLYSLASHDGLTKSNNFASFDADISRLFEESLNKNESLTMMMFDIDHFKEVNDNYGHLAGDKVLQHVVTDTQAIIDKNDQQIQIYRTGGEEFNIIFEDYTISQAQPIIDQIFTTLNQQITEFDDESIMITISVGVSAVQANDHDADDFFKRVDSALYQSKEKGRTQITVI